MIPIQGLLGRISKNIWLFSPSAWLSYAVSRWFHLMDYLVDYFGANFLSVLFPLAAHFGQFLGLIWGHKMGRGNAPDVAAQKTRFGVKNGSTMPTVDRPLLCKKWSLIFKKHRKVENTRDMSRKTKVKRSKWLILAYIRP